MSHTKRKMPYRLDLCGTWLDHPWLSSVCHGSIITVSIEPTYNFIKRGGMATSTRAIALNLWGEYVPDRPRMDLALELYHAENIPGSDYQNGSQDSFGMMLFGCNKFHYAGDLLPDEHEALTDEDSLMFLQEHVFLLELSPRKEGYNAFYDAHIEYKPVKAVCKASKMCWEAIKNKDIQELGDALNMCHDAHSKLFPLIETNGVKEVIEKYRPICAGCRMGAGGGGGYLVIISDHYIDGTIRITPCRPD